MARYRWRRRAAVLSGAMLIITCAAWAMSTHRRSGLSYEAVWAEPIRSYVNEQGAVQFAERLRLTVGLEQSGGSVWLQVSPSASDLGVDDFEWLMKNQALGREVTAFHERWDRQSAKADKRPRVYWNDWSDFGFFGAGIHNWGRGGVDLYALRIPHWILVGVLACATCWLASPLVRRVLRRRRGRCAGCGYDRRGLALGAICPECAETK